MYFGTSNSTKKYEEVLLFPPLCIASLHFIIKKQAPYAPASHNQQHQFCSSRLHRKSFSLNDPTSLQRPLSFTIHLPRFHRSCHNHVNKPSLFSTCHMTMDIYLRSYVGHVKMTVHPYPTSGNASSSYSHN